jgi:predicted ATPase
LLILSVKDPKQMISNQYLVEVKLQRDKVASFDAYPFCLNAVRHLDSLELHPAVTFFIGENGSGKSTLLEAIAVAWGFNPEGGTRNFAFETRASHSALHEYIRLSRGIENPRDGFFLRAESFFNVATEIEKLDKEPNPFSPPVMDSYGGRSLHEQSHGESFLALIMNRFSGKGLYILDEPEAALSPTRQMSMIARMHELVESDSQFIVATHSPIIMAYPNALIYLLAEDGIERIEYMETEHYRVTRDFINNHVRMLDILMSE